MRQAVCYVLTTFVFIALPLGAHATVVINEVAWMGTHTSPNHEWVELYNSGPLAVSLDGWRLTATDGTPNIALSGTISAGGYFLLERTSDDSVPGIPADLIYTGALGNSGEILELFDVNGARIDRVDGSDNWAIGGDNTTKDTLQRVGGGWVTARPTPRAPNSTEATAVEDSGGSSTQAATSQRVVESVPYDRGALTRVSDPLFSVSAGGNRFAQLGVPISFVASAHSGSRELVGATTYVWNMGDGTVRSGREVAHTYTEPGTYVVALEGRINMFREEKRAHATVTVVVEEPKVAIVAITDSYIELQNSTAEMIDLSGMTLAVGMHTIALPSHTYIAGDTSVRLSRRALGMTEVAEGVSLVLNAEGFPIATLALSNAEPVATSELEPSPSYVAVSLAQMTGAQTTIAQSTSVQSTQVQTAPTQSSSAQPTSRPSLSTPPAPVASTPQVPVVESEHAHDASPPVETARLTQTAAAAGTLPATSRDSSLLAWVGLLLAVVAGASVLVVQLGRSHLAQTEGVTSGNRQVAPTSEASNTLPPAEAFTIIEADATTPADKSDRA